MNTKLHAVYDSQGRPLNLSVTAGQVSDYIGARALVSSLPKADWLLGDRGYDADWLREALKDKGISARGESYETEACRNRIARLAVGSKQTLGSVACGRISAFRVQNRSVLHAAGVYL